MIAKYEGVPVFTPQGGQRKSGRHTVIPKKPSRDEVVRRDAAGLRKAAIEERKASMVLKTLAQRSRNAADQIMYEEFARRALTAAQQMERYANAQEHGQDSP